MIHLGDIGDIAVHGELSDILYFSLCSERGRRFRGTQSQFITICIIIDIDIGIVIVIMTVIVGQRFLCNNGSFTALTLIIDHRRCIGGGSSNEWWRSILFGRSESSNRFIARGRGRDLGVVLNGNGRFDIDTHIHFSVGTGDGNIDSFGFDTMLMMVVVVVAMRCTFLAANIANVDIVIATRDIYIFRNGEHHIIGAAVPFSHL